MIIPEGLKYTKEHEWIRIEGESAFVGITDYAQDQLGDVVMAELPAVGSAVKKNESLGVVESVKSVSDIFSPITGTIQDKNDAVLESPSLINEDPYGEGWLVKIKISNLAELEDLMDAAAYKNFLEQSE